MRLIIISLAALLILGACGRERSFDERYDDASGTIENRGRSIDRELESEPGGASRRQADDGRANGTNEQEIPPAR